MIADQRYDVRVPLQRSARQNFVASIQTKGSQEDGAQIENLSAGGVLLRTQRPISNGVTVECRFLDRPSGQGISFGAQARWCKTLSSGEYPCLVGLSVIDFQSGTREMWEDLRLDCLERLQAADLADPLHLAGQSQVTDSLPIVDATTGLSVLWQSLLDSESGVLRVVGEGRDLGIVSLRKCAALFSEQQMLMSFRQHRTIDLERAIAAHELRGPLGLIKSTLGLVNSGGIDLSELKETGLLNGMLEKCDQGLELIARYLSHARARGEVAKPRSICLSALVGQTVSDYKALAEGKKIELKYSESGGSANIFAVELEIHQIVRNLLNNSIKYSNANTTVRAEVFNHKQETQLRVIDQGVGISSTQLGKLFSPFGVCGNTPTNGESQTGIGLYLIRQLVEHNRGRLHIESQLNQGTTVTLVFPTHSFT